MNTLKTVFMIISACAATASPGQVGSVLQEETSIPRVTNIAEMPVSFSVIAWVDSLVKANEFDYWCANRERIQSAAEGNLSFDAEHGALAYLFSPWSEELPRMRGLDSALQLQANWALIRSLHMQQNHAFEQAANELIHPEAVHKAGLPPFWWVVPLVLFTLSLAIWANHRNTLQTISSAQAYENPHVQRLVGMVNRKEQHASAALELALLEFNAGWSPIELALNRKSMWSSLSPTQRLVVHLIHRNIDNADITAHLGITKGHFYNERSAIRKRLKLGPTDDIGVKIQQMAGQ